MFDQLRFLIGKPRQVDADASDADTQAQQHRTHRRMTAQVLMVSHSQVASGLHLETHDTGSRLMRQMSCCYQVLEQLTWGCHCQM